MNFARKAAIFFVSTAFMFLLFALPGLVTVNRTIGNASTIKHWLRDSKFYDRAVAAVVEQGNKAVQNDEPGSQDNSLNRPEVQAAAEKAFNPQFLQTSTENVIDGIFGWLKGKTAKPEFQINLGDAKQKFADQINQSAKARYASLPVCPRGQTPPADSDPFAITCQLPGYDANAQIDKLTNDIVNNKDFLGDKTITADDIKPQDNGNQQPVYQKVHFLPTLYRLNQVGIVILAVLTLGAATGLVFLYPERSKGLRRVGIKLIAAGGILLALTLALVVTFSALNKTLEPKDATANAQLQRSGIYIAQQAEKGIRNIDLAFAIGYIAAGIGSLVAVKLWLKPARELVPATTAAEKKPEKPTPSKSA